MTESTPKYELQRKSGIECPKCGCKHLPVTHTRRGVKAIIRYRRCRNCGWTMSSTERVNKG